MNFPIRLTLAAVHLLLVPVIASAQHEHHEPPASAALTASSLGTVDFQTSCQPATKEAFNRGLSMLHSFWFAESRESFEEVLAKDSACSIAHWGIALSHWGNPFAGLRSAQTISLGKAAIDKGLGSGTPTTRERGYLDAVGILFSSADPGTQRKRVVDYETAMLALSHANPQDIEARIFAALAIAQAAEPEDKTFERQLRSGAMLEPLFDRMPKHPGLAHYIIHAYDVPPLAAKALPAARAYADIAPAVPHALHMPSHTFTRMGMWRESVATNTKSADTAARYREPAAVLHALDYMTYAYLQMGMDAQAKSTLDRAQQLTLPPPGAKTMPGAVNSFAMAAIPARYAMERQQWSAAAQLTVVPSPDASPYVEAMGRFARAVGLARSGQVAAAAPEIERLGALRDRSRELKDNYWAQIIDIQRQGAAAWLLFAQGERTKAIAAMRTAAEAEDATEKSAVTPGPLAPAREMLGYMLLEAGQAKDALSAFDAVIAKEPNRFLALYGAGKAAEQAREGERAKNYFRQIVAICKDAAPDRPELVYARKAVG